MELLSQLQRLTTQVRVLRLLTIHLRALQQRGKQAILLVIRQRQLIALVL